MSNRLAARHLAAPALFLGAAAPRPGRTAILLRALRGAVAGDATATLPAYLRRDAGLPTGTTPAALVTAELLRVRV